MTLTYSTTTEAIKNNGALLGLDTSLLERYLFTAEIVIDLYVGLPVPTGSTRVFPTIEETEISYEVKMAVALVAEYVKSRESVGDPTMGGIISSEKGLERSITYNKDKKSLLTSINDGMPDTARLLLEKYRSAGDFTSFNLLGSTYLPGSNLR